MKDIQIARQIYLKSLDTMKRTLDLVAFKFDCRTKEYKYFRSQIMDFTYGNLNKIFKYLEDSKIIKKCSCGTNLRKGYKNCDCGGSGYCNI